MNIQQAKLITNIIPAACPFARTIRMGSYSITIPPLCKLNPFYSQLMELRFKALEVLG